MNRTTTLIITTLLILGGLPMAISPATAQASGSDMAQTDPAGDVQAMAPGAADSSPSGQNVDPGDLEDPVDITGVRFFGESPTEINIGMSVASFARTKTPQALGNFEVFMCFEWNGGMYQVRAMFRYSTAFDAGATQTPDLDTIFLTRMNDGDCNVWAALGNTASFINRMSTSLVIPTYVPEAGTLDVRIPRIAFDMMNGDGAGNGLMKAGDALKIQAFSVGRQGSRPVFYDETTLATTTLNTDTGNDQVKILVPENIRGSGAGVAASGGIPLYGVETGTFQTVPLIVENWLDQAIKPELSFEIVDGDPSKWTVRLIKEIPVAPKSTGTVDGETVDLPGDETITLVVNSAESVAHKERLRLLIKAIDPALPEHLGAALVDVVGVQPPTTSTKTLYFHTTGVSCTSGNRWLNTLAQDDYGLGTEIEIGACAGGDDAGVPEPSLSAGELSMVFNPDVPFARDYTMNLADVTTAKIALKAIQPIPGQPGAQQGIRTAAHITVRVLAGPQQMAEGTLFNQVLEGEPTVLSLPLTWTGTAPGAKTRFVSADEPIRVQVVAQPVARTFEICNSSCPPGTQTEKDAAEGVYGRVYLVTGQSSVDLPVQKSDRAGPKINITASGALMSMRLSNLDATPHLFANPGGVVVYNITVRNEGVVEDTAKITARINQTGWGLEILPQTSYKLGVGQARSFNVRITAPIDGIESQVGGMTVIATSTVDKEARAEMPVSVTITKGQQLADQKLDDKLQVVDTAEESPGVVLVPTLAIVALAVLLGRRRRA